MPLLHPHKPDVPHLDRFTPRAAIPGGTLEIHGTHLVRHPLTTEDPHLPHATFGEIEASKPAPWSAFHQAPSLRTSFSTATVSPRTSFMPTSAFPWPRNCILFQTPPSIRTITSSRWSPARVASVSRSRSSASTATFKCAPSSATSSTSRRSHSTPKATSTPAHARKARSTASPRKGRSLPSPKAWASPPGSPSTPAATFLSATARARSSK